MEDNIQSVYNKFVSFGYEGTEDDFRNYISDDANIPNVYKKLASFGYEGTEDDFRGYIGRPKQDGAAPARVDVSDVEQAEQANTPVAQQAEISTVTMEQVDGAGHYQPRTGGEPLKTPEELEAEVQQAEPYREKPQPLTPPEIPVDTEIKDDDIRKSREKLGLSNDWGAAPFGRDKDGKPIQWNPQGRPDIVTQHEDGTREYNFSPESVSEMNNIGKYIAYQSQELAPEIAEVARMKATDPNYKVPAELKAKIDEINQATKFYDEYEKAYKQSPFHEINEQIALKESDERLAELKGRQIASWSGAFAKTVGAGIALQASQEVAPSPLDYVFGKKFHDDMEKQSEEMRRQGEEQLGKASLLMMTAQELEQAKNTIRLSQRNQGGAGYYPYQLWNGVIYSNLTGLDQISSMSGALGLAKIAEKLDEKGQPKEPLTEEEQMAYDALVFNSAVQQRFGGNITMLNRVGQSIPENTAYVLDFFIGSHMGAQAFGKGAASMAKKGINMAVKKQVKNGALRFTLDKALPTLAEMGAQTTYRTMLDMPFVYADATRRSVGTMAVDPETMQAYGFMGGKDDSAALSDAWWARFIDNGSEALGDMVFEPGAGMVWRGIKDTKGGVKLQQARKWFGDLGNGRIDDALTTARRFNEQHGTGVQFGWETAEEFAGGTANALFVGDQELKEVYSSENMMETALNCFIFGVAQASTITGMKRIFVDLPNDAKIRGAKREAAAVINDMDGISVDDIERHIDEDSSNGLADWLYGMNNEGDWNEQQRKAVMAYTQARIMEKAKHQMRQTKMREDIEKSDADVDASVNNVSGNVILASFELDGQKYQGTVIKGRVSTMEEPMDDGNGNVSVSYKYNPYLSSATLGVRLKDGSVKVVGSKGITSIDAIEEPEALKEQRRNSIMGEVEQEITKATTTPSISQLMGGFDFTQTGGTLSIQGKAYRYDGRDDNGNYTFTPLDEKGMADENRKTTISEKSMRTMALLERLNAALATNASEEEVDDIMDELATEQELDNIEKSKDEANIWAEVVQFLGGHVTLNDEGDFDPEKSDVAGAAGYLVSLKQGDINAAAAIVDERINELTTRLMEKPEGVQNNGEGVVGMAVNDNASEGMAKQAAQAVAFLQTVRNAIGEMQKEKAEQNAAMPVSQMEVGQEFPVMYDGQQAVAAVVGKDADGRNVVTIRDQEGNDLESGIDDWTDEQWETMRVQPVNETYGTDGTDTTETTDETDYKETKAKQIAEEIKGVFGGSIDRYITHLSNIANSVRKRDKDNMADAYANLYFIKNNRELVEKYLVADEALVETVEPVSETPVKTEDEIMEEDQVLYDQFMGMTQEELLDYINETENIDKHATDYAKQVYGQRFGEIPTEPAPEQTAMPMRKVKRQVKVDGQKKTVEAEEEDYLAVPAERTYQYLYEELASQGLTEQDANDIVNNNLNEANKTLDEAKKKTPSATGSAAARIAEKQQIEDAIKAAQGVVDYWNAVKAMHDKVVAERIAAQQAADEERHAQAVAEEEARRAEEEARRAEEERKEAAEQGTGVQENGDTGEGGEGERGVTPDNDRTDRTDGTEGTPSEEVPVEPPMESAGEGTEQTEEPQPIGRGFFGNIYDQFKGKVKEAFDFLISHREGDLLGVFHRDELGDIDLIWGSNERKEGLEHIIEKHINDLQDFSSVEEAMNVIDDVIKNGMVSRENPDKVNLDYNGYRVSIKKQIRDDDGNVIGKKNWVVTAFDKKRSVKEKERASSGGTLTTPPTNQSAGGVTLPPNEARSDGKGTENSGTQGGNAENNSQKLIKGEKWNSTKPPQPFKRSKKGDSHDAYYTLGKKNYGLTKADADTEEVLVEDYGGYINIWNAYERGEILLSPELAAAIKAKIEYTEIDSTDNQGEGTAVEENSGNQGGTSQDGTAAEQPVDDSDIDALIEDYKKKAAATNKIWSAWLADPSGKPADYGTTRDEEAKAYGRVREALEGVPEEKLAEMENTNYGDSLLNDLIKEERNRRNEQKEIEQRFVDGLAKQGEIGKPTKPVSIEKILPEFTSRDEQRPIMNCIYYDAEGYAVASDAYILMASKSQYDPKQEGKMVAAHKIKGVAEKGGVVEGKFMKWRNVISQAKANSAEIDLPKLRDFLAGVKELMKGSKEDATVQVRMPNGAIIGFEPEYLLKFVQGAEAMGVKEIEYMASNRAITGRSEDGIVLLMPKKISADYSGREFYYDLSDKTDKTDKETEEEPKKETKKQPKAPSKAGSLKIDDVGEKIAGARKDMRREIAKGIGEATVQSLIELPFSKAFKKPNLKKAVESGALREEDAFFFDAWLASTVNTTKPKVTQQEVRRKRYNPNAETNLERWAKQTFEALDFLKTFVEADETERDRIIGNLTAEVFPKREAQLAEFERIRELNKGRNDNITFGDCLTPNPVWVTYQVMQRLGYAVGDKLDIPFGILRGNTTGTSYYLYNTKDEHSTYIYPNSLEEGIDAIVWLARIKRGDTDIQHPVSAFYTTPTKSEMGDSGRFRVIWGGWSSMKNQEFDSKEAAEAFAAKKKDAYVNPIQEVKRRFGYKIMFRNPLTGERTAVSDMEFDTKAEAEAYMDGNYEAMNDGANEMLAKESGTKKEVTADDVVGVTVTYGKDGWQYAAVINAAYANNMGMPLVLQEFKTRGEAKAYADSVKDKVFETYRQYKAKQKEFVYFGEGEDTRIGEDYRGGKDVSAEDFMNAFGFRGVQFGNWTNQADRQMAVNQAYDAFMDLAKLIGMSPRAMSLNGELGIAFGARGSGNANAHYEYDEVVINLTKTRGAGSLAHEWWHALDNYFARRGGMGRGMVTDVKSIAMRDELRKAYDRLIDEIEKSNYYKRSVKKGDYWGRMHEVTARLLAEWVNRELKQKGELNTFLARGVDTEKFVKMNYELYKMLMDNAGREAMPFEEYKELDEALSGMPYPSDKEIDAFSDALRNIFETIEEREGENGAVELFSIDNGTNEANRTDAADVAYNAVREALANAGIEVVMATEEDVKRLKDSRKQLKDSKGTIRGWVGNDGKIHLTKDGLTAETPIHEYTHLWAEALQMNNPDLWEQIKGLLKGTPEWQRITSMKEYSNLKDDDRIAGEVLAHISGKKNAERMEAEAKRMIDEAPTLEEAAKAANLLGRMRDALKKFWTWVGKTLLGKKGNINIDQVSNMVLADLTNGVDPFHPRGGKRKGKTSLLISDRFQNGLNSQDDIYDALQEQSQWSNGASNLINALEKRYGGILVSASSGAKNAISKGLVPVPDNKFNGEDGEYHHVEFENENGERFVEAVPFVKAEDVEEKYDIRFSIGDETDETDRTDVPEMSDEEAEKYDAGRMTFTEISTEAVLKAAEKNKEDLRMRNEAVKVIGVTINRVRKAMAKQKEYDKATVDSIVRLARMMIENGYMDNMSRSEVKRLMTLAKNATGKTDITRQANAVVDLMLKHQLKAAEAVQQKLLATKGSKVNASGVEVQAGLDITGQRTVKAMKEGIAHDEKALADRISDTEDRMGSTDKTLAANATEEYEGLMMAKDYHDMVRQSEQDEAKLRHELDQAKEDVKNGTLDRKAYKELAARIDAALRKNMAERVTAFTRLNQQLTEMLAGSKGRAREFREKQMERVREIQHNANSDMKGTPASEHKKAARINKVVNSGIVRFLFKPVATFDEMLRFFGKKSVDGMGYLWQRFMGGYIDAADTEWRSLKKDHDALDEKVSEVMGEKMRWSDLFSMERRMDPIEVEFYDLTTDEEGNSVRVKEKHPLTQGNALYIYMVNKMDDGAMKLRRMGITDEDVDQIVSQLDKRFVQLADWIQDEFLPKKREAFNAVHMRMFGAPMAAIEEYFPLVTNSRSRGKDEDISEHDKGETKPSTITGSIIKRKVNTTPLDVTNADAFDVLLGHLRDMEHWAAFAELNRDMNTLLSYKRFKNQVLNTSSVRFGAGETLWNNFKDVCAIAADVYHPKVNAQSLDNAIVNISKGVTSAKISFRLYTALKQLLSYPAYFSEANPIELAKSTGRPANSFNWALDNLPGFAERWQSRQAGDSRLKDTDADWDFWKNKFVDTARRWGMTPNAFVDGITVAMGAKAIYESKMKGYLKAGYSEAEAKEKALKEASAAVNETQQSSQNAYLSAMQLDRTVASVALTVFRNASMGYERRLLRAVDNIKRKFTKGYKEESIEFMRKKMVREGLTEEQAKAASERAWNISIAKDVANVVIFGYVMQFMWNLGSNLIYLIFGDDDDEKGKMWEDAALHALAGPVEGLSGGSVISEVYNMARSGKKISNYNFQLLPVMSDLQTTMRHMEQDKVRGIQDIVNLVIQAGVGVNPQTITDAAVAIVDAADGDLGVGKEIGMLMLRIAQVPQSQLDQLYIDELGMSAKDAKGLPMEELAQRYAAYKRMKDAPLTGWAYSDEAREKVDKRYLNKFVKLVQERVANMDDEALERNMDGDDDVMLKKYVAKEVAGRLDGKATAFDKAQSDWKEETKRGHDTYQRLCGYVDLCEDIVLQKAQADADKAYEAALEAGDTKTAWQQGDRASAIERSRKKLGTLKRGGKVTEDDWEYKSVGLGNSKESDEQIMKAIRMLRERYMEYYGLKGKKE